MRHKQLQEYIDRLNLDDSLKKETIFNRQISENVDVAKVWLEELKENDDTPYTIFFIKNEKREYVGAVLYMDNDLQWYNVEKHRGKGYLTSALQEAVLPYIFSNFENEGGVQKITIAGEFDQESKQVAENVGFKQINESNQFVLNEADFDWESSKLNETDLEIDLERIKLLRNRIYVAHLNLRKICDELLMSYNYDMGLDEIVLSKDILDHKLVDDWATSIKDCGYSMYEVLEQKLENKDLI